MAEGFDFEEYYINEKVKTEAVIDRSGVEQQNPTENAETPTNNVVYYVSAIYYRTSESGDWIKAPEGSRICVAENIGEGSQVERTYYYLNVWHALGEMAGSGVSSSWDPKGGKESRFEADPAGDDFAYVLINDGTGQVDPITSFYADVFPRHETEINLGVSETLQVAGDARAYPVNQDVVTDPHVMKMLYGALGLYGGRWKGLKWLNKVVDKKKGTGDCAVIAYDRFKRCMDRLAEYCSEADVGFSVTYYDQSFAEEVTAEDATREDYKVNKAKAKAKHRAYMNALAAADRTKTDMSNSTSFADAYGTHLPAFLAKDDLVYGVGDSYGNTTALLPPVKTAIRAYFYPADELEADFSDKFKEVMDELSKVPFVWRFVSKKIRNKINRAKARYSTQPAGSTRMVFDMDTVYGSLLVSGYFSSIRVRALPRVIQVGATDGVCAIVGPNPNMGAYIECWNAAGGNNTFTTFKNASSNVDKAYTTITADELSNLLVEYFNAAVDAGKISGVSTKIDADEVLNKVAEFNELAAMPDGPEKDALLNEYWTWWNGTNETFGLWFLNVCSYMNYIKDNGTSPLNPADGIQVGPMASVTTSLANSYYNAWTVQNPGFLFPKDEYEIMAWDTPADLEDTSWSISKKLEPNYPDVWNDIASSPTETFGTALDLVNTMYDAYKEMVRATVVQAIVLGPVSALKAAYELNEISDDIEELKDTCNKLMWYQRVVEESPFTNLSTIDGLGVPTLTSSYPAHLMFPVKMYKRVRVKYRNILGRTRHKMVKRSIGVRWAEVTFTDASVFTEYPVVEEEAGNIVNLSAEYSIEYDNGTNTIYLEDALPKEVVDAGHGVLNFENQTAQVTVEDEMTLSSTSVIADNPGAIVSIKIPLAPTQPDGSREPVVILYKMPGLPYNSEIRRKAFAEYGSLSQASWFEAVRNTGVDPDKKEGWKVFHRTSDKIADLREGIGIHDKVAMLLSILKHEFGDSRVQLVETYRSMADQEKICSGGPESAFLSWHNYGLAAKVLILKPDGKTPIEKDDDEVKRLWEIARAFTEGCLAGKFGAPCNVVWCARLMVGPSLFDWEFLPIGVGHKDAPKFRDMLLAQMDPVYELGYVDVDGAGYVRKSPPEKEVPYVLSDSSALAEAKYYGGHRYMSPENIRDFPHVSDIVLYDAREYVDLIKLKMNANGTGLPKSGNIYDWKALNQDSCDQLVRYYAMVGSIAASRALLAGDYVERYLPIDVQYASISPVEYVQGMLGNHYYDIRLCIARDGTAYYISLHDGILHVKALDAYPNNPPTRFDMHKQQRVDKEHILWGSWHDGVFYTEEERPLDFVDSEKPVIDGYVDGVAESGEALLLHQVIATKIHRRFNEIKKLFDDFGGSLMYDHIEDGPNASMADMLENEFGLIKAQDLLDFDDLANVLFGTGDVSGDERIRVDGSIYEKVVNNAQLAGIRRASLTKEHLHIRDLPTPNDGKTLYDIIMKGKGYMANDII